MDHQVEYDVNVGAALGEGREPMAFDEARRAENRAQVHDRRIKAFEMADLQNAPGARGDSGEIVGFGERRSHRFFDEDIETLFHQVAGDGVMDDAGTATVARSARPASSRWSRRALAPV